MIHPEPHFLLFRMVTYGQLWSPESGHASDDTMSQEQDSPDFEADFADTDAIIKKKHPSGGPASGRFRDEVFSKRVPAGKRTYFFDVKTTRSGEDFFLTITESKRIDEARYEKHKIFLYKEDFGKFVSAIHEVMRYVRDECLPGYEFRGLPELTEAELDTSFSHEK